jgi:hypothetical protein
MSHVLADSKLPPLCQIYDHTAPRLLTTPGISFVAEATGARNVPCAAKLVYTTIFSQKWSTLLRSDVVFIDAIALTAQAHANGLVLIPQPRTLNTPISLAGCLSTHWLPQEVALEHAAGPEIEAAARRLDGRVIKTSAATYNSFGEWKAATHLSR